MIADAVFEGGGIRGIGHVGALAYMESNGFTWARTAGSSVGALIAALIAAGYSAKEMKNIMINTNFNKFKDRNGLSSIPLIGKPLGLLMENAMYSGDYVEEWVSELLQHKNIINFSDISKNGEIPLKIVASDITRRRRIVLPDDLIDYGIEPMTFPIAKAVRMSISIPFYFKPVKMKFNDTVCYVVDGCVCCSYPINIFDVEGIPRWPTIGFRFENTDTSFTSSGRTDTLSLLFDIANTMSCLQTAEHTQEYNRSRSIVIPTNGVEGIDFDISKEKSLMLYKYGYRSAMEFLKGWNFEEYVTNFRS